MGNQNKMWNELSNGREAFVKTWEDVEMVCKQWACCNSPFIIISFSYNLHYQYLKRGFRVVFIGQYASFWSHLIFCPLPIYVVKRELVTSTRLLFPISRQIHNKLSAQIDMCSRRTWSKDLCPSQQSPYWTYGTVSDMINKFHFAFELALLMLSH